MKTEISKDGFTCYFTYQHMVPYSQAIGNNKLQSEPSGIGTEFSSSGQCSEAGGSIRSAIRGFGSGLLRIIGERVGEAVKADLWHFIGQNESVQTNEPLTQVQLYRGGTLLQQGMAPIGQTIPSTHVRGGLKVMGCFQGQTVTGWDFSSQGVYSSHDHSPLVPSQLQTCFGKNVPSEHVWSPKPQLYAPIVGSFRHLSPLFGRIFPSSWQCFQYFPDDDFIDWNHFGST
jgi:hypothetical protein